MAEHVSTSTTSCCIADMYTKEGIIDSSYNYNLTTHFRTLKMLSKAHAMLSPQGKACLICGGDNRIKLWDVSNRREARNYIEKRHLSHGYTCWAWSLSNSKKDGGSNGNLGLFAVGTSEGTIIVWDLMRGVVKKELGSSDDGNPPPTDIVFSNDAKLIYVASQLNHINVYDIESGEIIKSLKTGKKSTSKLCHNPRADVLAVGSSSVKLIDVETEDKRKLSSHFCSRIHCMSFTNCGKYLISAGDSSEVVVFDVEASAASDDPVCTITTQAVPKTLKCRSSSNKMLIDILVGYDNCNGCIVRVHADSDFEVEISEISTKSEMLAGGFAESSDSVIVVCGNISKPKFHRIIFLNAEGGLIQDLKTTNKAVLAPVDLADGEGNDEKGDSSKEIVGASSVPGPDKMGSIKRPLVDDEQDATVNANSKMSKPDELTLEERLESMSSQMYNLEEGIDSRGSCSEMAAMPTPTSDSLVTLIDQALQSGDDSLLEQCLGCTDMDVIDGTARVLKTHRVVMFMRKLVSKFEKRPSRGILLTRWLSCVLRHHTSFLISVPDLSEQLAGLSQMLEQRLTSYSRLASLSGRLDLLMTQVAGTGSSGRGDQPIKPMHIYTEQ